MITRADVQRVVDAFILEETLYWWEHPIERVNTVQGIDAWDGYHWLVARQLAQDQDWVSLKHYMDSMSETYLRETMEGLIQSESLAYTANIGRHAPSQTTTTTARLHPTTLFSPKRAGHHERVGQSV